MSRVFTIYSERYYRRRRHFIAYFQGATRESGRAPRRARRSALRTARSAKTAQIFGYFLTLLTKSARAGVRQRASYSVRRKEAYYFVKFLGIAYKKAQARQRAQARAVQRAAQACLLITF